MIRAIYCCLLELSHFMLAFILSSLSLILMNCLLILSSRQRNKLLFLIDLEMGRTICRKFDEDIDNCPLQEGQGEKKV